MAGRISPLLNRGNEYSWKVPLAIIDGVVLGCECTVGESIGPTVDVGVNELPQAESNSINTKRSGRPDLIPLFLKTSVDFIILESNIEISFVIVSVRVSLMITNLFLYSNTFGGYSLLYRDTEHSIISQILQTCFDESVLPILICIVGKTIYFNAQVVICQTLPATML